jgi:hypothetical protein
MLRIVDVSQNRGVKMPPTTFPVIPTPAEKHGGYSRKLELRWSLHALPYQLPVLSCSMLKVIKILVDSARSICGDRRPTRSMGPNA